MHEINSKNKALTKLAESITEGIENNAYDGAVLIYAKSGGGFGYRMSGSFYNIYGLIGFLSLLKQDLLDRLYDE